MGTVASNTRPDRTKLYRRAILLAQITVSYNLIEGLVSVFFGWEDETLSLWVLIRFKMRVGRKLRSDAIIADAHCTKSCL